VGGGLTCIVLRALPELPALSCPSPFRVKTYALRLTAYAHLAPALWSSLTQRQALPVMLACLHDLQNTDEMALR